MRIVFAVFALIAVAVIGALTVWRVSVPMEVSSSNATTTSSSDLSYWEVEGVKFQMPPAENSSTKVVTTASGGSEISYQSEFISVKLKEGKLTVDGKNYGDYQAGDEVDLREKGKVLVNGVERKELNGN